jgi:hypothetical protein
LHFAPAAMEAERRGEVEKARQLLRLDRGRSVFCQRQLSVEQWQGLLARQGLRIERAVAIAGERAIRFWDVGLRPFAATLLEHRRVWKESESLPPIKRSALAAMDQLLKPVVKNLTSGETCMNLLVVRKD